MLQDTNRALQLYMNKILMKIINNKQLEDVLSIDQPAAKPDMVRIKSSPAPTKTVSTTTSTKNTNNTNTTTNRQRRRTISYWGKVPPAAPEEESEEDRRRHSSIPAPQPERSVSSTTSSKNSGWAKALRRMSGIGWSSPAIKDDSSSVNNDSAFSEESSGSSTPSLRRSNELGTLDEE